MKKLPLVYLALFGGLANTAFANSADDQQVYDLAQGCYAIKSPDTGGFLQRHHAGGPVNNGLTYKFNNVSVADAEHFYFKPTTLSNYMITDKGGRFLGSHIPYQVSAGQTPGPYVEWRISPIKSGDNYKFRFYSHTIGLDLRHAKWDGGLMFINLLPPYNGNTETSFELIEQNDCTSFPEAQVNAIRTDVPETTTAPDDIVEGFADAHTHLTSYEFMGGKFMHGKPFHKFGISWALDDSRGIHGPSGALDIIGNLMGYDDVNHRYDTRGFPNFPSWPNHQQISHQQSYYKWIERAHKAGLRVLVSHLVENEVLCTVQKTVNPASWVNPNSCLTTDSINLQIQRLREMQDYIDAQSGGPGKGFFRIVKTSEQAREVISSGKLAVIMGMEVSEAFNCGQKDGGCTRASIDRQLDNYYDQGIRVFFPIHRFDNKFGGAKIEDGILNLGQAFSSGHFFDTKECDFDVGGAAMTNGFPLIGKVPVLKEILGGLGLQPYYDESYNHCNNLGLTGLGEYLINRMMDKNIMIEIDHMSPRTTNAVLTLAEKRNYSGLISSHSHTPLGENGIMTGLQDRLAKLGGYMAVYNANAESVSSSIDDFLALANQYDFYTGVGLSTDVNGIAPQAGPRPNNEQNGVQYPFTSFDGKYQFNQQQSGNRTFNYNTEGVAHYGLLADHIEDLKNAGTATAYTSVMRSAEAYLQMWKRTEDNNNHGVVTADNGNFYLVNVAHGKCFDINGNDDGLADNANVQSWDCHADADDQKWIYEPESGKLHNFANKYYCLDYAGNLAGGANIKVFSCVDTPNQAFDIVDGMIHPRADHGFAIDTNGTHNGANVVFWETTPSQPKQRWTKRPDDIDQRWVELRDGLSGKCIDVANGGTVNSGVENSTSVQLYQCDGTDSQLWLYDRELETLTPKVDYSKCLDIPSSDTSNGNQLIVYQCHTDNNQKFSREGWSFRSKVNLNKSIDASAVTNNAAITIWNSHNGKNQQWYPVIR
jgi:microsomal dipeptidase-like Zn-dependent dipeptidase